MADNKLSDSDLLDIKNQIVMAEKLNENKLLPQMREGIERYTGRYIPPFAVDWDIVLNEVYSIIQYELPTIFYRNPKVFLKPRGKTFIVKKRNPVSGKMEETFADSDKSAKTQEHVLNYILSKIRFKQETRKVLLDALLFKHGVLWHGYKGDFGMTEEQSIYIEDEQLFVKRICPMQFIFDPNVTIANLEEAKWIARWFYIPKKDILEDKSLDVDKLALKGELGYAQTIEEETLGTTRGGLDFLNVKNKTRTLLDYADPNYRQTDNSKFIKVYEILRRPSKAEKRDGGKGNIILYTKEQKKPLRVNPWPYKAEGWPAKILMFNEVPDSLFGMADMEVYGNIADQKNIVVNLQLRNAQENSKVWVGIAKEGANEEDITRVKEGNQTIIFFEGGNPRDKMFVSSPGGQASNELYMLDGRIQGNLDEKSGVTDLKKGFLRSGEESATSVEIRNAGASARPAYRQDIMADFLKESCHYLNQLEKQFFTVQDAIRIVGSLDVEWSESPTKEEIQAEVDVELDVVSMLPESPEKEIQELTTILKLMTDALNDPAVSQKLMQEGKIFNLSPIIENLLLRLRIQDPDVFRNVRADESEGSVSVKELHDARANVAAALSGQDIPSPPAPGQDHRARLEAYITVQSILQAMKTQNALLSELIMAQDALAQEEDQKMAPKPGQSLKAPSMNVMGAA